MDIAGGLAGGTMMTVATQTLLAATGQSMSDSPSAIIIGAGPSGLAMAHEMKHKLAFQDFTIYEKRDEVGGAWATNRYPGAGCDLPTHLHDFSFNLNPSWSKELCDREEVLEYINTTVDKFELRSHIHTSVEAVRAHWLEKTNMWCVTLKDSRTGVEFVRYATVLILAAGGMNNSRDVKIEGMDQFQGDLFHIAQWPAMWGSDGMDHVQRKRIAVIGNGCSAAQLIPKLVKSVADIKQFARSTQWYYKRSNRQIGSFQRAMYKYIPLYQRIQRLSLFLESEGLMAACMTGFSAPKAHAKFEEDAKGYILANSPSKYHKFLTPDFPSCCERRVSGLDYLEALHAENLEVVPEEISKITKRGITCVNGTHTDFDVIILVTEFQESQFAAPIKIFGARDDVSLAQYWTETRGAQAYFGSLVSGFPNFGILAGPNTIPANHASLFACEVSIEYLSRVLIAPILDNRATAVTVRQAVEDRYNQTLQAKLKRLAFQTGCTDRHTNEYGRDVVSWPGLLSNYWLQARLKGGEGVVYKGGGGAWWINYLVRWVRSLRKRTWLALLMCLISLRLRAVRSKLDREIGRYKPVERRIEGYLSPLRPLRDEISKVVFKS